MALSTPVKSSEELAIRLQEIAKKLEGSDIPSEMKEYYREHLKEFGTLYLNEKQNWRRDGAFNPVKYTEKEELFRRIQRFAKSGNIISVVKSVENLEFLEGRQIEIIDESNISSYSIVPTYRTSSHPRLIVTTKKPLHQGGKWAYTSLPFPFIKHRFAPPAK